MRFVLRKQLLTSCVFVLTQIHGLAQRSPFELIDQVARKYGLPVGSLELREKAKIVHPVTGVELEVGKVVDTRTGETYVAAVDQNGKAVEPQAAEDAEDRVRKQKVGKMDTKLAAKVKDSENGSKQQQGIPVIIWMNVESPASVRPDTPGQENLTARSNHLSALEQHMNTARAGVLKEVKGMDANARAARYSPAIFATLSAGQIRRLERNTAVAAFYTDDENSLHTDDLGTTARAERVWASGNLGLGMSGRLAVHESDGVSEGNPYLNNLTHPVIYFCSDVNSICNLGKNIGDHASQVAGVIASTHPLHRGLAPSAPVILSANSQDLNNDSKNVDAFEWAVGNGAGVVNLSWGTNCPDGNQSFSSRYADWATRSLWITQTISSGNRHPACSTNMRVSNPGGAWSVITVGSQNDLNSGFWNNDAMSSFSRYIDPNSGAMKPEVVAVGENVTMTDNGGGDWLGINSGTSFSAPAVAGVVMQMLARQPGQIHWPETNKAAIVASAMHDIVSGTDFDGHGSVVATVADDTYRNGRFRNDHNGGFPLNNTHFTASCAPSTGTNCRRFDNVFSTNAGTRVRVAIAWNSWSTGGTGTSQLGADIDMFVVGPNNTIIASSSSIPNAFELVDFTAPTTGAYDIIVRLYNYASGWPGSYVGVAWSFGNSTTLPNYCAGEQVASVASTFTGNIARTINTANGGTYFDGYTDWSYDQSGREGLVRLVLPVNRDVQISDTNSSMDLHLVQLTGAGCNGNPVTYTKFLSTIDGPAKRFNLPAGTYYIIADGYNGHVGSTNLTINIAGPSSTATSLVQVPPPPATRP